MPKLLLFAPCDHVIIAQDDNNISLISILQEITIALALEKAPEDVNILHKWQIFTLWLQEASDDGKTFEQSCDFIGPDGRKLFTARGKFRMERRNHRHTDTIVGFPLTKVAGECLLKLSIREDVENSAWREVAAFPLLVKYEPEEKPL